MSPQTLFQLLLKKRGYFTQLRSYKRTAYYNKPTAYQIASFGARIAQVVKGKDTQQFQAMMETGLSPNACTAHGESLVHTVCRHGNTDHFRVLLELGVDVRQTDDYGRTPMHDACWAAEPSFEIARELLKQDPYVLFIYDDHGSVPLSYCCKPNSTIWNNFLVSIMDELFPTTNPEKARVPLLFAMEPNSRPVPDPENALPIEMAQKIACGQEDDDDNDHDDDTDDTDFGFTDHDETTGLGDESSTGWEEAAFADSKSLRAYLTRNNNVGELLKSLHDD